MQGKVSMVVPCYNKVDYIGAMLESVIAQVWDNIELILVNDGSTDGTREVIASYEPKLRKRGYEVVVVEQENAGCCAAVYTGLLRMTGDYFCLVDCDDELMPEYVSRMTGWLDEHIDYEVAACSYFEAYGTPENQTLSSVFTMPYMPGESEWLKNFLLCRTLTPAWIYMTRRPYADRITKYFCTERRKTYEPLIVNPISSGGGKVKYFHEGLYKFNQYSNGFVNFKTYGQIEAFYEDYYYLHKWTIERLGFDSDREKKMLVFARVGCLGKMLEYAVKLQANEKNEAMRLVAGKFRAFLKDNFEMFGDISDDEIITKGIFLPHILEQRIYKGKVTHSKPTGRIIGYGALGKAALRLLPVLKDSLWEPTELWDKNCDGVEIKKPEFESVKENDMIIIFPLAAEAFEDVCKARSGINPNIISRKELDRLLPEILLPQIGNLR